MLANSMNLYNKLDQTINSIEDADEKIYVKAIFSEYVIIKCAEEIKSIFKKLIYDYLSKNGTDILAFQILHKDRNATPRDYKDLEEIFKNCSFDITGLDKIQLIVTERHNLAHNSSTTTKIYWDYLKIFIQEANDFFKRFRSAIDAQSVV